MRPPWSAGTRKLKAPLAASDVVVARMLPWERSSTLLLPIRVTPASEYVVPEIDVETVRILRPVRTMRNYILPVNIEDGYIRRNWPDEAIYVGREAPKEEGK